MFITAFLAVAQNGNLSRCPSIGQWLNCGTFKPWNRTQQQKEGTINKHNLGDSAENYAEWGIKPVL